MLFVLRLLIGYALACYILIANAYAISDWQVYRDTIYECRLQYPSSVFVQDPLDVAQEGQRFSGTDETIYFRVLGFKNSTELSAAQIKAKYFAASVPGDVVYERTKTEFVVLSGYRDDSIFYVKVSLSPDKRTACVLEIVYPRKSKNAFDGIVTRMSRSFAVR
jgi:hypothetical protein